MEGKVKVNKWEDKDGNNRQKFYISADIVRFLPNGKKENSATTVEKPAPKPSIESIVSEDEMPF